MRFRIPRSILRAAIAANVFVAASAACYSSIPGNRNNSYQPIGQVDVALPGGLLTFGRTDKLPNFVLYSPVSTNSENNDVVVNHAEPSIETTPTFHRLDGECEIAQDFSGCWMTCPEEIEQTASVADLPTIEDQKQVRFIDQQYVANWAGSATDAVCSALDMVRDYAVVAPFDSGEAVAEFFALSKTNADRSVKVKDSGNIFVYVIEQVDETKTGIDSVEMATELESAQTSVVTVNPFQSGVQDLIAEIESSIASRSLGCGYDPYESCFPDQIAESVSVNELVKVENTRIVSEDEFIPIQFRSQSSDWHEVIADAAEPVDAGVGHCAIPEPVVEDVVVPGESWQPKLEDARKLVENWIEPNWDVRKWEFVTKSRMQVAEKKTIEEFRHPKFRWDAVYGSVDSPMLSEIPIDPSLTLVHELYPQPRWYLSSKPNEPVVPTEGADSEHLHEQMAQIEVATIEPKSNNEQLVPMVKGAWGAISNAIDASYSDLTRLWQRCYFDSKRLVASQMKKIGSLLLRSADSLEGNIGIAKRDAHQSEGNR